jgi:hypothetical protein
MRALSQVSRQNNLSIKTAAMGSLYSVSDACHQVGDKYADVTVSELSVMTLFLIIAIVWWTIRVLCFVGCPVMCFSGWRTCWGAFTLTPSKSKDTENDNDFEDRAISNELIALSRYLGFVISFMAAFSVFNGMDFHRFFYADCNPTERLSAAASKQLINIMGFLIVHKFAHVAIRATLDSTFFKKCFCCRKEIGSFRCNWFAAFLITGMLAILLSGGLSLYIIIHSWINPDTYVATGAWEHAAFSVFTGLTAIFFFHRNYISGYRFFATVKAHGTRKNVVRDSIEPKENAPEDQNLLSDEHDAIRLPMTLIVAQWLVCILESAVLLFAGVAWNINAEYPFSNEFFDVYATNLYPYHFLVASALFVMFLDLLAFIFQQVTRAYLVMNSTPRSETEKIMTRKDSMWPARMHTTAHEFL